MADRRRRNHDRHLEYRLDRLLATKLEQVYDILVPERVRRTGEPLGLEENTHEDRRHLRPGFIGPAEGGKDDCQPDGDVGGLCPAGRLHGS